MTRTQLKDARRNIRRQFVSYISIVVIAMIAVLAYLGIALPSAAIKAYYENYYAEYRLWDLEITSTLLMDEEDLAAIRAIPGVETAEGLYEIDAELPLDGKKEKISVMSLTRELALPELLAGRLPEAADECAVEQELVRRRGLAVGQRVSVETASLAGVDPLAQKDFVITGVFRHPDHVTFQVAAKPYLLVPEESFNREGMDGAFMKARVLVAGAPKERFDEAYFDTVKPVESAVLAIADERAQRRHDKLYAVYEEKIDEGQARLDGAAEKLSAARKELDEGWTKLKESEKKLEDAKKQLDDGGRAIAEAELQLEAIRGLANQALGLIGLIDDLGGGAFIPGVVRGAFDQYQDGVHRLGQGKMEWYAGGEEYLDGLTLYENGKKQLEKGEREYAEGKAEYDDGVQRLDEAKELRDQLGLCRWVVLNDRGNAGYMYTDANVLNLSRLSLSFSLIFIGVGALVIYATIGRLVEEQRKLVGATKAMGLYNREIFGKYLLFGMGGAMLGAVLGVLLSYYVMQTAIIAAYRIFFLYDRVPRASLPIQTGILLGGALLLSFLAVWFACTGLLHSTAISLMQGTQPKGAKRARRSAKKSLYARLILLNMRTDLRRVAVTTVSIAGCCMLLVAGFTMKYAISRVNARQFGQIVRFGGELYFNPDGNENAEAELKAILDREGLEYLPVRKADVIFKVGDALTSGTVIVTEADGLDGFYGLLDAESREQVSPTDGGVLASGHMLEYYSLAAGDLITIYDAGMDLNEAKITGGFNNYFGQLLFFTPAGYESVFGEKAVRNCFLVKLGDLSLDQLREKLSGIAGFDSLEDAFAERRRFDDMSSVLNLVIVILLILAAVMAYFILMNLSMTYIQRKTKELTIMRINGFTVRECVRYVAWDLALTTAAGIALGLLVGNRIALGIVKLVEQPYLSFVREPDVRTFVFCGLITSGFSLAINGFALRKIKSLKLSDAL